MLACPPGPRTAAGVPCPPHCGSDTRREEGQQPAQAHSNPTLPGNPQLAPVALRNRGPHPRISPCNLAGGRALCSGRCMGAAVDAGGLDTWGVNAKKSRGRWTVALVDVSGVWVQCPQAEATHGPGARNGFQRLCQLPKGVVQGPRKLPLCSLIHAAVLDAFTWYEEDGLCCPVFKWQMAATSTEPQMAATSGWPHL
eukprot:scaffold317716_cov22-Tisochrysis_lutea.AAC.1